MNGIIHAASDLKQKLDFDFIYRGAIQQTKASVKREAAALCSVAGAPANLGVSLNTQLACQELIEHNLVTKERVEGILEGGGLVLLENKVSDPSSCDEIPHRLSKYWCL
jgi:hypothetical protein